MPVLTICIGQPAERLHVYVLIALVVSIMYSPFDYFDCVVVVVAAAARCYTVCRSYDEQKLSNSI